ncbi:MAG: hypothetical protein JJU37_08815 [Balneolaceae bacterium]|nr:hypothetical protein [Balneolaceae bacterium]
MAAFRLAHEMQADMIELDVLLTKDGRPVVFHDEDVRRLTDGSGPVSGFTFEELKQLDAGTRFSKKFSGEKIPSLEEVLDWLPNEMLLNIEIKPETVTENRSNGIEEKVIELVEQKKLRHKVLLSSFNYVAVKRFKQIQSDIKTGLLYEKNQSKGNMPSDLIEENGADFFHCSSREMKSSWQKDLQKNNIPYLLYTINRNWAMKRWIKHGASGLFSDKPDLLRNVYNKYQDHSTGY